MTAWRMATAGSIEGARTSPAGRWVVDVQDPEPPKPTVAYARVPSHDQKHDLDRQVARIAEWAAASGTRIDRYVRDIASGLNDKRRELGALLADPQDGTIIVEHRDRGRERKLPPEPRGRGRGNQRGNRGGPAVPPPVVRYRVQAPHASPEREVDASRPKSGAPLPRRRMRSTAMVDAPDTPTCNGWQHQVPTKLINNIGRDDLALSCLPADELVASPGKIVLTSSKLRWTA